MRQPARAGAAHHHRIKCEWHHSVQSYGRIERAAGLPRMETLFDLLSLFELTPSAVLGQPSYARRLRRGMTAS